jgi:DNA-directed RNA polymerase specialized sigma24 family protein
LTIKKYLKQFEDLDREIKLKQDQLRILHALKTPLPLETTSTKTQTGHNTDKLDSLDAVFVGLEDQYITDIVRLLQLRHDIQLIINSLDDSTQRVVLTEKYINLKQPEDIAAEIPCDVRTVYRWLNEAIITLQTQHPGRFETCQ